MRITPTTYLLAGLVLVGLMPLAMAHESGSLGDIDRVNGDIEIGVNSTAGDLDTVNGDIEVGKASKVGNADTVNGDIRLDSGASARSLDTVNGSIKAEQNVVVTGSVDTVNGNIRFDKGGRIEQNVETVNGDIRLDDTQIGHNIETVQGDIVLQGASVVTGSIVVHKNKSLVCLFGCDGDKPRIELAAGVQVGSIILEREVELAVNPAAKVGKIEKRYEKK